MKTREGLIEKAKEFLNRNYSVGIQASEYMADFALSLQEQKELTFSEDDLRRAYQYGIDFVDWLMDRGSSQYNNYTPPNEQELIERIKNKK